MAAAARRGSAATAEPPATEVESATAEPTPEPVEAAPAGSAAADAAPPELVGAALGRIAYEAYRDAVGGQSVHGEELPTWDDHVTRKPDVAAAWCAAAQAVLTATFERKQA
jgi:hypothetical protein